MQQCCNSRCILTRLLPSLIYGALILCFQRTGLTSKSIYIVCILELIFAYGIEKCFILYQMIYGDSKFEVFVITLVSCLQYHFLLSPLLFKQQINLLLISECLYRGIIFLNLITFLVISAAILIFIIRECFLQLFSQFQTQQNVDQGLHNNMITNQFQQSQQYSTCPICLLDFDITDYVSKITSCGHCFHEICLKTWLEQHSTCPCCRSTV